MTPSSPRYVEHTPASPLHSVVECYWTIRGRHPSGTGRRRRILPDGCMDVIFDLTHGRADVIGTMTRPLDVRQRGFVDLLGVRFRPGAAPAMLGVPADTCVDDRVDFAEGWGPAGRALLHRVGEAATPAGRLEILDGALTGRLEVSPPDRLVLSAARRLDRVHPPSVAQLSEALGVSRRTLERRFRGAVGLSPWHLARIGRFRRAVTLLLESAPHLSGAAHGAGYHDQPHMTRDFRELAGRPPGAWLQRRRNGDAGDAIVQDTAPPPL